MIREAVERVILEEGIDTYKGFVREVIEDGRRSFKSRLQEMTIPGRYRAPAFIELPFAKEAQLPSYARARHDVPRRRRAAHHPRRDARAGLRRHLGLGLPLRQRDAVLDAGRDLGAAHADADLQRQGQRRRLPRPALELPARARWSNHNNPMASTGNAWYFLIPSFTGFIKSHLALAAGARVRGGGAGALRPHRERVPGRGHRRSTARQGATTNFGLSCVGGGAKMVLDGLDYGAAMWNPEGDMGDMEMWELIEPFLYLCQRVKPNTAGPGRHRGGSGYECLRLAWKTPFFEMQNIGNGRVFMQSGLWGGYPAACGYRHNIRNTNFFELVERGEPYPVHEPDPADSELAREITGDRQFDLETTTLPEVMTQGDLYLCMFRGAAGLGDPLERPYEAVMDDLEGEYLLPRFAESVYGVVAGRPAGDRGPARGDARGARGPRPCRCASGWPRERERVLDGDMIEPVKRMYAESMRLSERWAAEFRAFWDLPDDFDYDIAHARGRHRQPAHRPSNRDD